MLHISISNIAPHWAIARRGWGGPPQSCGVEIVVLIGIWKCLLYSAKIWSPSMFLFADCSHCILWHALFGETFTVIGGNYAEHIFVKCPKKLKLSWRPKWHLTGVVDVNIKHCSSLSHREEGWGKPPQSCGVEIAGVIEIWKCLL